MQALSLQQQQASQYSNNAYTNVWAQYEQQMQQIYGRQAAQQPTTTFNPYVPQQQQQVDEPADAFANSLDNPAPPQQPTTMTTTEPPKSTTTTTAPAAAESTTRPSPIPMSCPNHHACQVATDKATCDTCGGAHGTSLPMVGCRQCNFDICYTCARHHSTGKKKKKTKTKKSSKTRSVNDDDDDDDDPLHETQLCPNSHRVYFVQQVWPSFWCNYCMKAPAQHKGVYYCSLCDWGTCGKNICGRKGIRTPPVPCPRNHQACLAVAPSDGSATFSCRVCLQRIPDGTEMYHCWACNPTDWSICARHHEQDVDDEDGLSC